MEVKTPSDFESETALWLDEGLQVEVVATAKAPGGAIGGGGHPKQHCICCNKYAIRQAQTVSSLNIKAREAD